MPNSFRNCEPTLLAQLMVSAERAGSDEILDIQEAADELSGEERHKYRVCLDSLTRKGPTSREDRVAHWIRTRIGENHMDSRERAMKLLEEAIELVQSEGITLAQVLRQAAHVFGRPPGEPTQEAGGVAVCLLGWCAANTLTFEYIADAEIERIEARPIEQIRDSVARKNDADLERAC